MSSQSIGQPTTAGWQLRIGSRQLDIEGIAITAFVLGFAIYTLAPTVADPDLWGHVKFGGDTWRAGGVVTVDPYSYLTEGQAWINHEWLSEVIFWLAFSFAGASGLVVLKLCLALASAGIVYFWLLGRGLEATRAGILLALAVPPMAMALGTVRPHVFTVLFFAITIWAIRAAERGEHRSLWWLVPLFAAWVNLHGGFLAGLGILTLWLGVRSLGALLGRQSLTALLPIAVPVAASFLATLLNPYGPDLWTFLLRTATVPRPEITEWQGVRMMSLGGAIYVVLAAACLLGLSLSRRPRAASLVAVCACASLLPLIAVRHLPLFAVATLMISAEHMWDAWEWRTGPHSTAPSRLVVGVSAVAALALVALSYSRASCIEIREGTPSLPVQAVALIQSAALGPANLAVDFNWGEYAIWHLGPAVKVSVDGRRETVYSDEIYRQNMAFMYGTGKWDELIDGHPTDLVLVSKKRPAHNLMLLKPGWVTVYEDSLSALFVAEGSPVLQKLQGQVSSDLPGQDGRRCFP